MGAAMAALVRSVIVEVAAVGLMVFLVYVAEAVGRWWRRGFGR
jgi:hypothetical protein